MNGLFLHTLTSSKLIIDPTNIIFILPLIINVTIIKTHFQGVYHFGSFDKCKIFESGFFHIAGFI